MTVEREVALRTFHHELCEILERWKGKIPDLNCVAIILAGPDGTGVFSPLDNACLLEVFKELAEIYEGKKAPDWRIAPIDGPQS